MSVTIPLAGAQKTIALAAQLESHDQWEQVIVDRIINGAMSGMLSSRFEADKITDTIKNELQFKYYIVGSPSAGKVTISWDVIGYSYDTTSLPPGQGLIFVDPDGTYTMSLVGQSAQGTFNFDISLGTKDKTIAIPRTAATGNFKLQVSLVTSDTVLINLYDSDDNVITFTSTDGLGDALTDAFDVTTLARIEFVAQILP